MDDKYYNQLLDKFESLPESLQNTIRSDAANERIAQIAQRLSFDESEHVGLAMIAGYYVLGEISPDELVPTLVEDLGIGITKANQIAEDLYTNVFSEIGPDFETFHGYSARPKLLVMAHKEPETPKEAPEEVSNKQAAIKTPETFSDLVKEKEGENKEEKESASQKTINEVSETPPQEEPAETPKEEKRAEPPKKEQPAAEEKTPEKEIKLSHNPPQKTLRPEDLPKIKIVRKTKPKITKNKTHTPPQAPIITPEPKSEEPSQKESLKEPEKEPLSSQQATETTPAPHDYKKSSDPYREPIE